MPREITCRGCGELKPHYARGFCRACYMRDYRRRHSESEAMERVVAAYERILSPFGISTWLDGSTLHVQAHGQHYETTL